MNQEQWRGWIEIVGVISVVITLAFVALEIRQNTNAVRSAVIQGVSGQSMQTVQVLLQDDSLREAMRAVDAGTASAEQHDRISLYFAMLTRLQQNRFLQTQLGVVDKETMQLLGGQGNVYRREGYRTYWERRRDEHPPEFQAYMDELIVLPARDAEVTP